MTQSKQRALIAIALFIGWIWILTSPQARSQATYRQVGRAEALMETNQILTNIFLSSKKMDLGQYAGVEIRSDHFGLNNGATNTVRFQWSDTGSNWVTESILNQGTFGGTAQFIPLDREVLVVSTNGMSYIERFNRSQRFFRVQVKSNIAASTNGVYIIARPLND